MPKNDIQKKDSSEWLEVLTLSESLSRSKVAGLVSSSTMAMLLLCSAAARNPVPIIFWLIFLSVLAYYSYQRWQVFSFSKHQVRFLRFRKVVIKEISQIETIEVNQILAWFINAKISFIDGTKIELYFPMPFCAPDSNTFFAFIYQRISPRVNLSVSLLKSPAVTYIVSLILAIGVLSSVFAGSWVSAIILFLALPLFILFYIHFVKKVTKPLQGQDFSIIEPVIYFKKPDLWQFSFGIFCVFLIGLTVTIIFFDLFSKINVTGWLTVFFTLTLIRGFVPLFHAADEVVVTEGSITVRKWRRTFTCFLSEMELGDPYLSIAGQQFFIHSPTGKISVYNHKVAGESLHQVLSDLKAGKKIVPLYNPDFPGIRLEYNDALE